MATLRTRARQAHRCLRHHRLTQVDPKNASYPPKGGYNNHGQVVAAARVDGKTETIGYDANDHATTIDDGTTTINETLAPTGRVLERKVTNDTTHAVTEDTVYGYSDTSDSPAYTRPAAGGAVTSYIGACVDTAGTATWQIRNGHGDIVGTTDNLGAYTANPTTDEFGVGTAPATRLGYLGAAERFTTDTALGIIRMGARLYDPTLGRFLQTDPIPGGSANNYDYTNQDPVNQLDLGGASPPSYGDENIYRYFTVDQQCCIPLRYGKRSGKNAYGFDYFRYKHGYYPDLIQETLNKGTKTTLRHNVFRYNLEMGRDTQSCPCDPFIYTERIYTYQVIIDYNHGPSDNGVIGVRNAYFHTETVGHSTFEDLF